MGTQIRRPENDLRRELLGAMFTTAKELRHLAERSFGELFVPVEVLDESAHTADYALRPGTLGPIVVHAERERHWYPFRVTRVEAGAADGADEGERPRGRPDVGAHRPSIDWL